MNKLFKIIGLCNAIALSAMSAGCANGKTEMAEPKKNIYDEKEDAEGFVTERARESGNPHAGAFFKPGESAEVGAAYTGYEFSMAPDDERYGGGQYIGKLFTEGLGRAPAPAEYLEYSETIFEKGCTQKTLRELAEKLFSSDIYLELPLKKAQKAICIYRAVLNRDPKSSEIADVERRLSDGESSADIAGNLTASGEFAALMPGIGAGPYFWGENNAEHSLADEVITASELQSLLDKSNLVELRSGAIVLMDQMVTVPEGTTLRTMGKPAHYAQQARLIRTINNASYMLMLKKGASVENVWIDGNRMAFLDILDENGEIYWPNAGHCVCLGADETSLVGCRINDSPSATHVFGADLVRGLAIKDNLLTCYATSHVEGRWADGITHAARDSVIEGNHVIDATDVGIIAFRFISETDEPQDTQICGNRVLNLGNSAYAGLDIDSWHSQNKVLNFTGNAFINNELWTSWRAHMHIAMTLSPLAWTANFGDTAIGSAYIDNYTPDGLFCVCAAGITVDGVHDVQIRGNQLRLYINGDSVNMGAGKDMRPRIYSYNSENSSGDMQPGYEDLTTHGNGYGFIAACTNLLHGAAELKEAIIWEERRKS